MFVFQKGGTTHMTTLEDLYVELLSFHVQYNRKFYTLIFYQKTGGLY